MKRIILHIVAVFLIVQLIVTLIGLELHHHTCGKNGQRTFQIIETPECACEAEHKAHTDNCCHTECVSEDTFENNIYHNSISIDEMDCCQDEILDISITESFLNYTSKLNFLNINYSLLHSIYDFRFTINEIKFKNKEFEITSHTPLFLILTILKNSHFLNRSDLSDIISY